MLQFISLTKIKNKKIQIKKRSNTEKINIIRQHLVKEDIFLESMIDTIEKGQRQDKRVNEMLQLNNFVDDYDWSEYTSSGLEKTKSLSLGIDRGVSYSSSNISISEFDIKNFMINNREFRTIFNRIDLSDFSVELSNFLRKRNIQRNRMKSNPIIDFNNDHIYLPKIDLSEIENLLLHRYREARSETTKRIQNALFETLSTIIEDNSKQYSENLPDNFDYLIKKYKDRIVEALIDISDNPLKKKIIQRLISDQNEKNNILDFLIHNMIKELENEKQLLISINSAIDGFNEHLSDNKKLVITSEEICIDIKQVRYPIDILSSGEKHIFTFLALINVVGRSRDFLIIDEPEISLNVSWQRRILSLLKEIAPKTQIIVASHSPLISKDMTKSLVPIKHLDNDE
ncbi:hypothetical protein NEIFL0001_0914 [Neisseria flavescens SK114]|nr:hypothetical protein NEIFL0001_0914 [Neisseria flavescens SK114]